MQQEPKHPNKAAVAMIVSQSNSSRKFTSGFNLMHPWLFVHCCSHPDFWWIWRTTKSKPSWDSKSLWKCLDVLRWNCDMENAEILGTWHRDEHRDEPGPEHGLWLQLVSNGLLSHQQRGKDSSSCTAHGSPLCGSLLGFLLHWDPGDWQWMVLQ